MGLGLGCTPLRARKRKIEKPVFLNHAQKGTNLTACYVQGWMASSSGGCHGLCEGHPTPRVEQENVIVGSMSQKTWDNNSISLSFQMFIDGCLSLEIKSFHSFCAKKSFSFFWPNTENYPIKYVPLLQLFIQVICFKVWSQAFDLSPNLIKSALPLFSAINLVCIVDEKPLESPQRAENRQTPPHQQLWAVLLHWHLICDTISELDAPRFIEVCKQNP